MVITRFCQRAQLEELVVWIGSVAASVSLEVGE